MAPKRIIVWFIIVIIFCLNKYEASEDKCDVGDICMCYTDVFKAIFSLILPNMYYQLSIENPNELENLNSGEIEKNVSNRLMKYKLNELLDKLTDQDYRKLGLRTKNLTSICVDEFIDIGLMIVKEIREIRRSNLDATLQDSELMFKQLFESRKSALIKQQSK